MATLTEPKTPNRRGLTRLLPKLLLGAGVVLLASQLLPRLPRDQPLVLRLRQSTNVERIAARLSRDGDEELAAGFTLYFKGGAPRRVAHTLSLPNGRYRMEVDLRLRQANGGTAETTLSRRVNLTGDELTVTLDPSP